MPDKPLTVLTYAASASLAAAALVYFFNPNHILDGESAGTSASMRKKGIVGLSNPANDCFINSILQALAGLRELRLYLIRELHRRALDDDAIYRTLPEETQEDDEGAAANGRASSRRSGRGSASSKRRTPAQTRKLLSLQAGEVTQGLKDMLDRLNEKPIHKKTISAATFIAVLEHAFGTRISKSQQDAQELLQVVAERVSEEYHAGKAARQRARKRLRPQTLSVQEEEDASSPPETESPAIGLGVSAADPSSPPPPSLSTTIVSAAAADGGDDDDDPADGEEEGGFPLEGRTQSEIQCQHCQFVPKSAPSSFVMLTLAVPQKNNATLSECFDQHFKTEYIDDYKCDRCRLVHAQSTFEAQLSNLSSSDSPEHAALEKKIAAVSHALSTDPESPPPDLTLPPGPTRRIARHVRIVEFPQILVVHLSRSIYDQHASSTKNTARVSFPERLPLGGLLHRRNYKLLGVVCHKGTHHSGHYETFRRQHVYAPTPTPHRGPDAGPYSRTGTPIPQGTPLASGVPSPQLRPRPSTGGESTFSGTTGSSAASAGARTLSSPNDATTHHDAPSPRSLSLGISLKREVPPPATTFDEAKRAEVDTAVRSATATDAAAAVAAEAAPRKKSKPKKKSPDRWWRISDDKVKESKTGDVLGMQKEVYILFYEIDTEE